MKIGKGEIMAMVVVLIISEVIHFFDLARTYRYNERIKALAGNHSYFYRAMYDRNGFDFIKTAQTELKNLDACMEKYKDWKGFFYFIELERAWLINDINNKKLYMYSKYDENDYDPPDWNTYEFMYPEQVEEFKERGNVLEYEKIDYLQKYFNNFSDDEFKSYLESQQQR